MTKEWYLEFRRDQTRGMMELYYAYYKMKGGSLSRFEFDHTFPKWVMLKGQSMFGFMQLQDFIFRVLNKHFSV